MIILSDLKTFGWESALRGMRNAKESHSKSDTKYPNNGLYGAPQIGPNDLTLAKTLSKAGPDHGKYLRMIHVSVDITAPLYWWKEFDTYKIGTVANSYSTMHKIQAHEFTLDMFSREHLGVQEIQLLEDIIELLNVNRDAFNNTKSKQFWWNMIQLLPSSFNQKRTIDLNYQVLKNMYHARKHHKLDEWNHFCFWIEEMVPYAKELICQ